MGSLWDGVSLYFVVKVHKDDLRAMLPSSCGHPYHRPRIRARRDASQKSCVIREVKRGPTMPKGRCYH